jgi:hypothetical protein
MNWVQNAVRQFGLYLFLMLKNCEKLILVREDQINVTTGSFLVLLKALESSYVTLGKLLIAYKVRIPFQNYFLFNKKKNISLEVQANGRSACASGISNDLAC